MGMEHRPGSSSQEFLCKTKAINFCPGQQNGNWCYCQTNLQPAWEELFLLFPFSHISLPSAEVLVYVDISIGREVAREKWGGISPDSVDPQGEELRSQQSREIPIALIQGQRHLLFLVQSVSSSHKTPCPCLVAFVKQAAITLLLCGAWYQHTCSERFGLNAPRLRCPMPTSLPSTFQPEPFLEGTAVQPAPL